MMRLQIRKISGPDSIRNSTIGNPTFGNSPDELFTCHLNRPVNNTDQFPLQITVRTYSNRGILLHVTQHAVTDDQVVNETSSIVPNQRNRNCFRFRVTPSWTITGTSIYVHAVINYPDSEDVSYSVGSYHETIKHVEVYFQKTFNQVYWSFQEEASALNQRERERFIICSNEDAFLHIKTQGMYSDNVRIIIYGQGRELRRIVQPLHRNKGVVAVNMRDVIARYRTVTGSEPVFPLILTARVAPDRGEIPLEIQTLPLTLNNIAAPQPTLKSSTGTIYFNVNRGAIETISPSRFRDFRIGIMCHIEGIGKLTNRHDNTRNNQPQLTVYPLHTYEIMLSDLVACGLITLDEAIFIAPVAHPETPRTDAQIGQERRQLQNNFDKLTQRLPGNNNPLLINRFLDNSYRHTDWRGTTHTLTLASPTAIRKVLAQVQSKQDYIAGYGWYNDVRYICRDAWQLVSQGAVQHRQGRITQVSYTPGGSPRNATYDPPRRYDRNQEAPFGEYFLNYTAGSYILGISKHPQAQAIGYIDNTTDTLTKEAFIDVYDENRQTGRPESPNRIHRGSIKMHKGTPRASTGCLTYNLPYDNSAASNNNYYPFIEQIYPPLNGLRHVRRLNLICIDERNATRRSPDHETALGRQYDFHRYHDLINPAGTQT